jgi:hypothetical protein
MQFATAPEHAPLSMQRTSVKSFRTIGRMFIRDLRFDDLEKRWRRLIGPPPRERRCSFRCATACTCEASAAFFRLMLSGRSQSVAPEHANARHASHQGVHLSHRLHPLHRPAEAARTDLRRRLEVTVITYAQRRIATRVTFRRRHSICSSVFPESTESFDDIVGEPRTRKREL